MAFCLVLSITSVLSNTILLSTTGWRRPKGCLKLQVFFRKRATNYRALLRKMTYKDKASDDFRPPCTSLLSDTSSLSKTSSLSDTFLMSNTSLLFNTSLVCRCCKAQSFANKYPHKLTRVSPRGGNAQA